MARKCITGSLAGCENDWSPSIDIILGYEHEVLDASEDLSLCQQGFPDDDAQLELSNAPEKARPGFLP